MHVDIYSKLKGMLNEERYTHSLNVQKTAEELARKYNADVDKASTAGIIHDCAKRLSNEELLNEAKRQCIEIKKIYEIQPELLHGPVGARIACEDFFIDDCEIAHAITYHTTGCENMSLLDKIIYIADYIEPGRSFLGVEELRKAAYEDLDKGVFLALDKTIKYVIERGQLLDILTVQARNFILMQNIRY